LTCWDRSGVIVTEGFGYKESSFLSEFIVRYSRITPFGRHDPTIIFSDMDIDVTAHSNIKELQ
jgi:hypothetical protein